MYANREECHYGIISRAFRPNSNHLYKCGQKEGEIIPYYASINSSAVHPPGNRGAFAHIVSPGDGALAILVQPREPLSKTGLSIRV